MFVPGGQAEELLRHDDVMSSAQGDPGKEPANRSGARARVGACRSGNSTTQFIPLGLLSCVPSATWNIRPQ